MRYGCQRAIARYGHQRVKGFWGCDATIPTQCRTIQTCVFRAIFLLEWAPSRARSRARLQDDPGPGCRKNAVDPVGLNRMTHKALEQISSISTKDVRLAIAPGDIASLQESTNCNYKKLMNSTNFWALSRNSCRHFYRVLIV